MFLVSSISKPRWGSKILSAYRLSINADYAKKEEYINILLSLGSAPRIRD